MAARLGAYKPLFVGASGRVAVIPVAPRGATDEAKPLGRKPLSTVIPGDDLDKGSTHSASVAAPLAANLHKRFCSFQVEAKRIEHAMRVAAAHGHSHSAINSGVAQELLERYSSGLAADIRTARDSLRHGKWSISQAVHADYDALCFCLAVWELTHEVALSAAPSGPRVLHWYNRHYLEEDLAEWWKTAQEWAEDPSVLETSSPFWEPLVRLALADCRAEVLELLQRRLEKTDAQVRRFCEFLRRVPSLRQMDEVGASEAEQRQASQEVQAAAEAILREVTTVAPEHPVRDLLEIYAGCPQDVFDSGGDVAKKYARTWVEDLAYAHAWIFPDLRRSELGDLLRAVAQRHQDESIDEVDRVFFAILTLDVPSFFQRLSSLQEYFPRFFIAHIVDVLYYAGRVPPTLEMQGRSEIVPPRDWHFMEYAQELCSGPRSHRRFAVDYLRAGGSPATRRFLELAADQYCATATTATEVAEGLELLADLGLSEQLGGKVCRRFAQVAKAKGDVAACLRWACCAEVQDSSSGAYVSELVDELANEDLQSLLEVVNRHPRERHLASASARAGDDGRSCPLTTSGRLYFLTQYARCRGLRLAGQPASSYAPTLVRLLSAGVAAPGLARAVVEEDLLPALREEAPALSADEALLLMRFVHNTRRDPLCRVALGSLGGAGKAAEDELHLLMASCLSRAIMQGPAHFTYATGSMVSAAALTNVTSVA